MIRIIMKSYILLVLSKPYIGYHIALPTPLYALLGVNMWCLRKSRVGFSHKLHQEDGIKWFQTKYDGIILP